jgi:hypothetical protein
MTTLLDIQLSLLKIVFPSSSLNDGDCTLCVHIQQQQQQQSPQNGEWKTIDRTLESFKWTLKPHTIKFSKSMLIQYSFNVLQNVKFVVYLLLNNNNEDKILIGESEICQLHELIGNGFVYTTPLFSNNTDKQKRNPVGFVALMTEEVPRLNDIVQITFSAKRLPKKDCFFDSCDPYLTISMCTISIYDD